MNSQIIKKIRQNSLILMSVFIAALFLFVSYSEAVTQSQEIVESKEVTGEVVFLTTRMVTIEFNRTDTGSTEILIPVDELTQFTHLQDLQDIQQGDTVTVTYTDTYTQDENGKRANFKRLAAGIALVSRAATGSTLTSIGTGN